MTNAANPARVATHDHGPQGQRLTGLFSAIPDVLAAWQYGSSLRDDYAPGRSDIDILVAVRDTIPTPVLLSCAQQMRTRLPEVEATILKHGEITAGLHPGWSRHFYTNVARAGVRLYGPDLLTHLPRPSLSEAVARLTHLCQRVRLVVINATKAHEEGFWLVKYQKWVPLCLMELLDLSGMPEDRLRMAHETFTRRFPDAGPAIDYPYPGLAEVHVYLEALLAWLRGHQALFEPTSARAGTSR
ncbi:hypothetical protein AB0469_14510 [Streptomyces sp. NPDC093801]|uniref:hypothetical protein n=1 Tax=Streptomyces sp. NPDC093801 TaxID=3155203 RepID=UPI00344F4A08